MRTALCRSHRICGCPKMPADGIGTILVLRQRRQMQHLQRLSKRCASCDRNVSLYDVFLTPGSVEGSGQAAALLTVRPPASGHPYASTKVQLACRCRAHVLRARMPARGGSIGPRCIDRLDDGGHRSCASPGAEGRAVVERPSRWRRTWFRSGLQAGTYLWSRGSRFHACG